MGRILVVDDQKISRLTLAGILSGAGHAVRSEASGPDGIRAAREWLPDVVVLDVHMPEVDGFQVVASLKADPVTDSIPVVFLTGEPPTDDLIVRGLELGASDFLSKGCSKAELLARVAVMERIKRSHDELAAIARISDALLYSVDPEALARKFIEEAAHVFRAEAVVLAGSREDAAPLWTALGVERATDHGVARLLEDLDTLLPDGSAAPARALTPEEVRDHVAARLGDEFRSAFAARVQRGRTAVTVLILGHDPGMVRAPLDAPLLRNLTSQAAIAIEHALLNQQARVQARELERAMTERSRFFASLSHELRTPINAVLGYNHLLREEIFGPLSDPQKEALDKTSRSAQHLLELVDDILDISKIEAGKLEIFPEPVDVLDLLQDTAPSLQLQARDKGIELDIGASASARITTDPARLRQIVLNLLSNAVKFTERGRVDVRVEEGRRGEVAIRVRDTGPGIAPEDQARIFEEFEQARTSSAQAGTGLGLAISRRLAQLLGGSLEVESELGSGSTFTLTLPGDGAAQALADPD
jgi:signal transduction histidine kinase/ActR/RegA family two-component response regulator